MPGNVRPVTDERDALLAFLEQQRDVLRIAAYGLTEEQARATPTASSLSVGGLIKHVTATERGWMDTVLQRTQPVTQEQLDKYGDDFLLGADETLAEIIADSRRAAEETEEIIRGIPDLGRPVPVPDAPWNPKDIEAWSVRWVLLHLIEEIARHAGHADIIRESVDGATAFELMAGAEDWPETPWIKPWQPAAVENS
ncbi:DinB family protein [Amycolatopsis aidingensis]|uniref:DinB family protein n=1 Tax=Amycolatopsis aidingensis TaxID=2842453 RepID=UPI001C0AD2EA|nr:DinB family protein [Amycolatopsis aidingensis]